MSYIPLPSKSGLPIGRIKGKTLQNHVIWIFKLNNSFLNARIFTKMALHNDLDFQYSREDELDYF